MNNIFPFDYNLNIDLSNPENQVILWKIENYNSYLTDFCSNTTDKYIKFKYNLSGKNIIFTYYTEEKIFNVENLTNQQLVEQLEPIHQCANITIYELLTKIETCIENMPDESEIEDDDNDDDDVCTTTQVKISKLVTELDNKMSITRFENPILTRFQKLILDHLKMLMKIQHPSL